MTSDSFDLTTNSSGGESTANGKEHDQSYTRIALNYAYAITKQFQLGATYRSLNGEASGANNSAFSASTIGLNLWWNFNKKLEESAYVGLRYWVTSFDVEASGAGFQTLTRGLYTNGTPAASNTDGSDVLTQITLELGKRFHVGKWMGFHLTYSPNVEFNSSTLARDASGIDDVTTSGLTWNWLKFDVLF